MEDSYEFSDDPKPIQYETIPHIDQHLSSNDVNSFKSLKNPFIAPQSPVIFIKKSTSVDEQTNKSSDEFLESVMDREFYLDANTPKSRIIKHVMKPDEDSLTMNGPPQGKKLKIPGMKSDRLDQLMFDLDLTDQEF